MPKAHAARTCVVTHNGVPVLVREGQPFDADDPIVRDIPWLFANDVEEATARPGERRSTRKRTT